MNPETAFYLGVSLSVAAAIVLSRLVRSYCRERIEEIDRKAIITRGTDLFQ